MIDLLNEDFYNAYSRATPAAPGDAAYWTVFREWLSAGKPDPLAFIWRTPTEAAADRLEVSPDSLLAQGMDDEWFSNPENMPPAPGSWRWIKPGHPLWQCFKDL